MKLVLSEPETVALRARLSAYPRRFMSRIGEIETQRAVRRVTGKAEHVLSQAFDDVELIEVTSEIAMHSASLEPLSLRTLDAIHLASASAVSDELDAFITYDQRLAEAARAAGFAVVAPT